MLQNALTILMDSYFFQENPEELTGMHRLAECPYIYPLENHVRVKNEIEIYKYK